MKKAKIATCCHCGARTVLDVAHLKRVRLKCDSCGAPITRLAPLQLADKQAPRRSVERKPAHYHHDRRRERRDHDDDWRGYKHRKRRKKKSLFWEVLDEIEDIFD